MNLIGEQPLHLFRDTESGRQTAVQFDEESAEGNPPPPPPMRIKHLKEERKCKASLDHHWFAFMSKGTQSAMNSLQSKKTKAVNDSGSNNNYTAVDPVPQTVENGATPSGQETENVSETS